MPDTLEKLLNNNRNWAARAVALDADFFSSLTELQQPEYLWIGCSDSRVPANQITGLRPGEVFVHRNVANIVKHDDLNCMSVVEYAVGVLKVRHVIVCGHYGCGGVQATITGDAPENVKRWLEPVQDLYQQQREALDDLSEQAKLDRLCELNVLEQTHRLCTSQVVQQTWKSGQELMVHAWIYDIADGLLTGLQTTTSADTGLAQAP
jgi:carbonic anhydrase